jgi:hypothetical protein
VAASLPLFMTVGPVAALLRIEPITPGDWAIAGLLAIFPVLWRAAGTGISAVCEKITKT